MKYFTFYRKDEHPNHPLNNYVFRYNEGDCVESCHKKYKKWHKRQFLSVYCGTSIYVPPKPSEKDYYFKYITEKEALEIL